MKKKYNFEKHSHSYSDDRPVYEPEDNLYAGVEYENNINFDNNAKKSKIKRNTEKYRENYLFDNEI